MSGSDNQAEPAQPDRRRGSGRHAAPRVRGRNRAKLLGAAAVPTALLMAATVAPELAHAATAGSAANCTPATTPATTVTPVPKSSLTPLPGPSTPAAAGGQTAGGKPSAATGGGQAAAPAGASGQSGAAAGGAQSAPATGTKPAGAAEPAAAKPAAAKPAAAVPAGAAKPAAAPASAAQQQAATNVTRQAVQTAATQPGTAQSQDLIGSILGGIAGIFDPGHQNQQNPPSPSSSPSPSGTSSPSSAASPSGAPTAGNSPTAASSPAAPAPRDAVPVAPGATPSGTVTSPSAAASSDGPGATPSDSATASPSPSDSASPTGTPSPSAVASALANGDTRPLCPVDTSKLTASGALTGNVVPDQSWTLHTTKLSLYGAVFGGVYEVHSPTRTYRVLKFTVSSVDIDNLDMSTVEDTAAGGNQAKTFHVKGGPNTTSTMRNGPITMYVESLSGQLASLYGIPLPPLGTITLTPDTLPQWLYNLIGAIPIPIDMALTGVKAVQAGQFGGDLHIPGMHLYNDDQPYDGL
ncbi:hypothetical protein [Kitasatospora acidiphila]|uniref:hypothetical protein n=1 Tax=Kitasatospora acidiphila TaxID=2567942 RepID=UPI003C767E01